MYRLSLGATIAVGLLGCYGGAGPDRAGKVPVEEASRSRPLPMLVVGVAQTYASGSSEDFRLFNLVEFWRGSDPSKLRSTMREIQFVTSNGIQYLLTAAPNRLDIATSEDGAPVAASLVYDPLALAWFAEAGTSRIKLAEWTDASRHVLMLIHSDGSRVAVRL